MSLLRMSLSGAILIMVVVIIRAITINKLPKMTFLIFWGIAIVRLLLPISLPSASSVFTLTNKSVPVLDSVVLDTVEKGISDFTSEFLTNQQTTVEDWTTQVLLDDTPKVSVLFLVWIIGASLFAGYFLVSYLRCRHEFMTSLPVQNNFVKEWLSDHPLRRTMEVRSLTGISTPLTYGLIHPVILIPKKTNWENERQLQYMLFHEYVHIRRLDTMGKLIAAATICIHWFNPMVWVLYILFNRDIELACDERVVRYFGENDRATYARMLIGMEEQRSSFAAFYNYFAKDAIEERIESIMKSKKASITALAIVLGIMFVGTATAFTAPEGRTSMQNNNFDIKVYNGDTELNLSNKPFIYDEQIYLPLREILNSFGISDITWREGSILINMHPAKSGIMTSEQCEINLGSISIRYTDIDMTGNMYTPPVLKDNTTYVTEYFFEDLIRVGQIPDYRLKVIRDLSPESYYDYGEEVFIGTLAEQDLYKPVDESGNTKYVKRIIVDENRNTIAVVTVENQMPDKLRQVLERGQSGVVYSAGYSHMFTTRIVTLNANGETIDKMSNIIVFPSLDDDTPIAYIPPAYQISRPHATIPPDSK